jgi:hypothetical protein
MHSVLPLKLGVTSGLLTWFLSTQLLHQFLLTSLLTLFPKEHFPEVLTNLIGFWKSFVCGGNMGGAGVVLGLGGKSFLWWVFGGFGIFSPLPSLSVFYTGNLPRGVPEVDDCGLTEIGNSKEETRGTQFR